MRKDGANFIGWTDIGGQYREGTRTLIDGRSVPVFELVNNTRDRRFLLTNQDGYEMTYNGLVLAVERRRSNGWQAFGSYTLSRTSGLQPSSGTTAGGAQVSTIRAQPIIFGRDPNDLTNARGRLPGDRPHVFRAMGSVDVPRTGMVVAASMQHFSGKPWAANALIPLPQTNNQPTQRVQLEPRGSRRLSSQTLLDLRVSRTFSFGASRRLELLVDVLNLLNDTAEEGLVSESISSSEFCCPQHLRGSPPGDGRPQSEPRSLTSHAGIKGRMHPFVIRDFQPGASVRLGDTAVSSWVRDSTTISISGTAAHAAGTVDVIVTNPGGPEARLTVRRPISVEVEGF